MDCLNNVGRLPGKTYKGATMYTTLSPCDMCTGACVMYGVGRVVIGENDTFVGGEKYLKERGIEVVVLESAEAKGLMKKFIEEKPDVWSVPRQMRERKIIGNYADQMDLGMRILANEDIILTLYKCTGNKVGAVSNFESKRHSIFSHRWLPRR